MKICTLSSGSSGNSAFLEHKNTKILIDCGLSGKHIENCLKSIGEEPENINYILVTHEHIDHIRGLGVLSRKYNIPIFASHKTWKWMLMNNRIGNISTQNIREFQTGEEIFLKDISVKSFPTPHDAVDPHGFRFECDGHIAVLATDIGHISTEIENNIANCECAILEANHDEQMLTNGAYPEYLKERILSDYGHLSNRISAAFASKMVSNGTKHLILSHLSSENNTPTCVTTEMQKSFNQISAKSGSDFTFQIAPRYEPSEVITA